MKTLAILMALMCGAASGCSSVHQSTAQYDGSIVRFSAERFLGIPFYQSSTRGCP
jgi:uncharacterized protein YceK